MPRTGDASFAEHNNRLFERNVPYFIGPICLRHVGRGNNAFYTIRQGPVDPLRNVILLRVVGNGSAGVIGRSRGCLFDSQGDELHRIV